MLALAWLNVVINEDLYDHDFVEKWCYGFAALKERVQEYTPARAAEVCWLSEETSWRRPACSRTRRRAPSPGASRSR